MKKIIVLSAFLMPMAAYAQDSSQVTVDAPTNNPNERVCRTITDTGSRLNRSRVCRTRAEWAQQRREMRQDVERSQANRNPRQF